MNENIIRGLFALILVWLSLPSNVSGQDDSVVEQLYETSCASCHGANMQGGQTQSLIDKIWQFGSARSAIFRNIKYGIADFSMPAFAAALSDRQINQLVDFLLAAEEKSGVSKPPPPEKLFTLDYEVQVRLWADELNLPWGIAFLDEHRAMVTERSGPLRIIEDGRLKPEPVQGTPEVLHEGQGGLLDVEVDPDFRENGWIYLTYSHSLNGTGDSRPGAMTRLVRGRVKDGVWTDQEVLFQAPESLYLQTRHHYGSRIAFDPQGYLFFSIGERGMAQHAQDLGRPNGKVHRIHRDGSIPQDNPFLGVHDAMPSIFTYGNRNPQGLAVHPQTGEIWETEHGPMGGDELNLVVGGRNYGWPVVTYGRNYDGAIISDRREKPGVQAPALYWNPSIAVCGIEFVRGDLFPRWRNALLVSALKYEEVRLLRLHHDHVLHQEIILKNAGRVRDVACGPDGAIYVVLNGPDAILRLTPTRDLNDGPE